MTFTLRGIGDDIIERLKNRTAMTIAGGKVIILITHEAYRLRAGEITAEDFRVRTGGYLGSSAGIILGAAAGAAVGAVVPGIGNIAGAFTGGVIGAMGGEEVGRFTASLLEPRIPRKQNDKSDEQASSRNTPPPNQSTDPK